MPAEFVWRVVLSVLVGGSVIAAQSILAEKYPQFGGFIVSIPTTLPMGLFFIGWTQGASVAVQSASVVPVSLGNCLLFAAIFISVAQWPRQRFTRFLLPNLLSLAVWFALSIAIIRFQITAPLPGIIAYIVAFAIAYQILKKRDRHQKYPNQKTPSVESKQSSNWKLILLRACAGGTVIGTAVLLAKILNPLWGGVFSVFPASFISIFNIILLTRGPRLLIPIGATLPQGSLFFLLYILCAHYLFPLGILPGTLLSEALVLLAIYLTIRWKKTKHL
jgi:hypothetical protein